VIASNPNDLSGLLVADAAWPMVADRAARGAIGVLPVGAAGKAHGRHLPMNTDWQQAQWLTEMLIRKADVLVWPILGYGHYPAFTDYPGSTSLREATFRETVVEILGGIQSAGVVRCLILNTGISTISPLRAAMERVSGFDGLSLVNVYQGAQFRAVQQSLEEQPFGGHADEIETSIMLAIAPDKVDMTLAEAAVERRIRGRFHRLDAHSPNYSPSGAYGDPTLASAEKGRRLLSAMLADVLAVLG
jgi:creatinine amidohydrolase